MASKSVDYMTFPLEQFTVRDLTDALGIKRSADLLNTSARAIYTTRNTNRLGYDRIVKLREAVLADEATARQRLTYMARLRRERVAQPA